MTLRNWFLDMRAAQELQVETWLNTDQPLSLAQLKGKVVAVYAFQMLCPGCVEHTLPQAKRVRAAFSPDDVSVIGLHTVFEHHEAMQEVGLRAFLHEYRIGFPVAIDRPGDPGPIPGTMGAYQMRGTPTLLLISHGGHLHKQHFGHLSDLHLGAELAALVHKKNGDSCQDGEGYDGDAGNTCSIEGCT